MGMKPINAEESGCDPISSNCVIWQGPDIECINLCKGDTVSDVVNKLALELCNILDILDIECYDITCFNLTKCDPEDFKALIQFLIERICALEDIDPTQAAATSAGCPDCVVDINPVFYFTNPQGDTETTMQLTDYVTAIGNKLAQLCASADTTNNVLANHENRLVVIENEPVPVFEVPLMVPTFVLPPVPTPIDDVLVELELQYGQFVTAVGDPVDLYTSYLLQTPGLNNLPQLAGSGNMNAILGWEDTIETLAQIFGNTLLQLQDIRSAILNIQANCCPQVCDDIAVVMSATIPSTDTLKIFFTGAVPAGYLQCNPLGTLVRIEDSTGGFITEYIDVLSNLNNSLGTTINLLGTPVNGADDLTITATLCFTDPTTGTQCQSVLVFALNNTANCPNVNLTPLETSINYSFPWLGGAASFTIDLYDESGTSLLQSHSTSLPGPGNVVNTFTGLTGGLIYLVRVTVTVGTTVTVCNFTSVTTLLPACTPPTGVGAVITIP